MLTLADVFEALTGIRPENTEFSIRDAVIDSRLAVPGSLFVALPGDNVDGHDYVRDAFERGASYALIHKDLSAQFRRLDLVEGWQIDPVDLQSELPVCIRVVDSIAALQKIAHFWRRHLHPRVIGITGS